MPDTDNTDSELPSIHANEVKGLDCPACGHPTLMIFDGYITCTLADCPNPDFAEAVAQKANKATDRLLHEVIEQSKEVRSYIDGTPVEFQAIPVAVLNTYLTKDSDTQSSDVYQDDTYLRGGNHDG